MAIAGGSRSFLSVLLYESFLETQFQAGLTRTLPSNTTGEATAGVVL